MKKLAIIFPGIGYNVDKPLLYYSRKLLQKYDYEVRTIDYGKLVEQVKLENFKAPEARPVILKFLNEVVDDAKKQLEGINIEEYEHILIVGKSIGTVAGALYAQKNHIQAQYVFLTPLEHVFSFVTLEQNMLIFCGTEDLLADVKFIEKKCQEENLLYYMIEGGNHSLETGDIDVDLKTLSFVMAEIDNYLGSIKKTVYDFSVLTRDKHIEKLSAYRGKVLLIMNTATGCGFTPQYTALEDLYRKYQKDGLEILDFPCNQFAHQAPGTEEEIYTFCTARYDISFPQFAKVEVNGENQSELFAYLKMKKRFEGFDLNTQEGRFLERKLKEIDPQYMTTRDIKWNFTKFLVDKGGHVVARFEPPVSMTEIEKKIQELL